MHELPLMRDIVSRIQQEAKQRGAKKVKRVFLALGETSCLHAHSISHHFQEAAKGTVAQDAQLEVVQKQVELRCRKCGRRYPLEAALDRCLNCGRTAFDVERPPELELTSIEVEEGAVKSGA